MRQVMPNEIVFNGTRYASPEAMPPEVRRAYEQVLRALPDEDRDGIPDVLQGKGGPGAPIRVDVQTQIVFNGRAYASLDEMPPEARRVYEQALAATGRTGVSLTGALRNPATGPGPTVSVQVIAPERSWLGAVLAVAAVAVLVAALLGLF